MTCAGILDSGYNFSLCRSYPTKVPGMYASHLIPHRVRRYDLRYTPGIQFTEFCAIHIRWSPYQSVPYSRYQWMPCLECRFRQLLRLQRQYRVLRTVKRIWTVTLIKRGIPIFYRLCPLGVVVDNQAPSVCNTGIVRTALSKSCL